MRHRTYVPFRKLLPQAGAIVHHGGIGTAAHALKAGVPQLVTPIHTDQFDNARRLVDLGVARSCLRSRGTPRRLVAELRELLQCPAVAARCAELKSRLEDYDSLDETCDLICNLIPEWNAAERS